MKIKENRMFRDSERPLDSLQQNPAPRKPARTRTTRGSLKISGSRVQFPQPAEVRGGVKKGRIPPPQGRAHP